MLDQHLFHPQPHLRGAQRDEYRLHMCGLCHALGDAYGYPYRILTGHDAILLNLLITAQQAEAPQPVERRCPLNPLLIVRTNQGEASTFASAAALALAYASADDHVQDSGGRDLAARAARRALQSANATALRTLDALGFDAASLSRLTAEQQHAEADSTQDASQPTALVTSRMFAAAAQVAGMPHNADPLASIGAAYGAYIYLSDAYQDLAQDIRGGHFNPLRPYADADSELNEAGMSWLLARLERIAATMREQLPRLTLHRDRALITRLLCEPVEKMIGMLNGQGVMRVCQSCANPIPAAAGTVSVPMVRIEAGSGGGEPSLPGSPQRRKKPNQDSTCSDCCDGCSNNPGTSVGCCDCCGCCNCCQCRGCCNCCDCCDGNCDGDCCPCN